MIFYKRNGSAIQTSEMNPFKDKMFAIIGDSFSANGYWAKTMIEDLGNAHRFNCAESGAKWAGVRDTTRDSAYKQALYMKANINVTPDYILCFLGVNDVGNQIAIGDIVRSNSISDVDLTTYTGGMQACLNQLQNDYPNAVIYVGYTPSANGFTTNSFDSYIQRMKDVCHMYGVRYVDTISMGITQYSDVYAECFEAGVNGGHPTETGHTKIGHYMARVIRGLE